MDKYIQKLNFDFLTKFKTRDEQEVVGYYEVLELIFDNYSEIKILIQKLLNIFKKKVVLPRTQGIGATNYEHISKKQQ